MRPYFPGGILNALATAQQEVNTPDTPSIHRLRRGLPGYLILFAPHAFAPQRQCTVQRAAFATGIPPDIYAFHRYTGNSTLPSGTRALQFLVHFQGLSPGLSRQTYVTRLRALYAQ